MLFENPVSVAQQRFSTMNPRQSADKDCKMNGGAMARDEDWPSGLLWGFLLWRVFIVFFFYVFSARGLTGLSRVGALLTRRRVLPQPSVER